MHAPRLRNILLCLYLLAQLRPMAQPPVPKNLPLLLQQYRQSRPDSMRVYLLTELSIFYRLKPGEERQDLDSALLLAGQAADLSRHLGFAQGEEEAGIQQAMIWLEAKNFVNLHKTLATLSDTGHIRVLQEMMDSKFYPAEPTKANTDTALQYARQALAYSSKAASIRWQLAILLRLSIHYYGVGDSISSRQPVLHGAVFSKNSPGAAGTLPWIDSLFTWMAACLRKDPEAMTALHQCRQRLSSPAGLQESGDLLRMTRQTIVKYLSDAAQFNLGMGHPKKGEKYYLFAENFQKTFVPAEVDLAIPVNLSYFYYNQGEYANTLQYAMEAVSLLERSGPDGRFNGGYGRDGSPYWAAGVIHVHLNKQKEGLEYYKKAIPLDLTLNRLIRGPYLSLLTRAMIPLGQTTEALTYCRDNLRRDAIYQVYDDVDKKMVYESIGDCYHALQQDDAAEKYYLQAFEIVKRHPAQFSLIRAYQSLGSFYIAARKYEKGKFYLEKMLQQSGTGWVPLDVQRNANYFLFLADSAAGRAPAAYAHLHRYKALSDSLFSTAKAKAVQEVTARFEVEKKDSSLRLQQQNIGLLVQQEKIREGELQRSRYLRNALIGGSVLLILLLTLLYNRYQLRQRSNRRLQAQQAVIHQRNQELVDLNARQQRLLAEKEWLIREVHHRVKNNLQIILSLLNMQTGSLKDEGALNAFGGLGSRIRAISLIHQKLYQQGRDMTSIPMAEYIRELAGFLEEGFADGKNIRFNLHIDPVDLDAAQCVPLGLILNEAILNAIKYAFPAPANAIPASANAIPAPAGSSPGHAGPSPSITISLRSINENISLTVADNGVGLPHGFNAAQLDSLGFELIETLTQQLDGQLTIKNTGGLSLTITFVRQAGVLQDPSLPQTRAGAAQAS